MLDSAVPLWFHGSFILHTICKHSIAPNMGGIRLETDSQESVCSQVLQRPTEWYHKGFYNTIRAKIRKYKEFSALLHTKTKKYQSWFHVFDWSNANWPQNKRLLFHRPYLQTSACACMQTVVSRDLSHVPHLTVWTKRLCLTLPFSSSLSTTQPKRSLCCERNEGGTGKLCESTWAAGVHIFAIHELRVPATDHSINHQKTSMPNRHPLACCSLLKCASNPSDFWVTFGSNYCFFISLHISAALPLILSDW